MSPWTTPAPSPGTASPYYLYTSGAGPLGTACHFASAGLTVTPRIEANSVLTLAAFLRTGEWSTVLPQVFRFQVGELPGTVAVPLKGPADSHTIGLVVPDREPK